MTRRSCGWTTVLLALSACAEASLKAGLDSTNVEALDPTAGAAGEIRVDVFPAEPVDAQGQPRALPQTIGPIADGEDGFDVGAIALAEPGTLSGFVTADVTTPWAAGLPTTSGPVAAEIRVTQEGSVQRYAVGTNDDGVYQAVVIPASERPYVVSVVPSDPNVPMASRTLVFRSADEQADFDLGPGVAIYGRVVSGVDEVPLADARVSVVDELGVESAQARTDSGGWYVLYAQPDHTYQVVCAGRDHGRDPVLSLDAVYAAPESGGRADFAYPSLTGAITNGRVVDAQGFAVSDATVRFTATALDRYDDTASLVVEDSTDVNGSFEASLLAGAYEVEILPPPTEEPSLDHGAVRFAADGTGLSLGDLVLPDLVPVSGTVVNTNGGTVGDARVTCREVGFGGRSWSAFADGDGVYQLMLPPSPVDCTVQPPGPLGGRLAWTTTSLDPAANPVADLVVRPGRRVTGSVTVGGSGEAFSLVEVRDATGALLGSTLTAGDVPEGPPVGSFELRIDLFEEAADAPR